MTMLSMTGFEFILRWLHFFFGVMWIGHLYYFNMTQMNIMPKADAATKAGITRVLLPEALFWFRWGAMWTMVTGVIYLMLKAHGSPGFFSSSYGTAISVGAVFGLTMWANVWFVIWPKQKIVMASAEQVANGGAALPNAADAAAKARLGSRSNTMFSIPMLFFMGAASHLPFAVTPESKLGLFWIIFLVIFAALEINALKGKEGPIQTLKGVIACGFGLSALIYVVLEICLAL
jgi:uncharacterized membrane protein